MKPLGENDPRKLGPYVLEQLIDKGGMARVYLGRSPSGRLAAVKLMNDLDDPRARERFQREFKLAQLARNPYLVKILDMGSYGDMLWYASEYVPGPTLQAAINQSAGKGLGERTATVLAHVLCSVLTTIHAKGITHRDLKPANIILGENGPRIIDFGIAHMHGHTLTDSLIWESSGYIAPERFMGGTPQASWDIFALGVIVAYTATGRMPFPNDSREQNMRAVLDLPPNLDGVPRSLLPFVRRCLDKDAVIRSNIRDVRDELGGIMKDEVRGMDWLPDYIETEIIKQTRQFTTRPYSAQSATRTTQPKTASQIVQEHRKRHSLQPVPQPVRRSTPQQKSSGAGGVIATLVILGLLVFGGVKFGPGLWQEFNKPRGNTTSRPTTTPVDPTLPPAPRFTAAKSFKGKAYTRPDSASSLTVTKVVQKKYRLYVSVQVRGYGEKLHPFEDGTCVRIKGSKWSGTQPLVTFGWDSMWDPADGPPAVRNVTLIFTLAVPGEYTLLDKCDSKRSTGVVLGKNVVVNPSILKYDVWVLPVLKVYRTGSDVNVTVAQYDGPYVAPEFCVKTPKGLVSAPFSSLTYGDDDSTFGFVKFENVPKGGKLYLTGCNDIASYNGNTVTLP